ncbi:hypothetical protein MAPG_04220 [Magnaporthiopsis poae ATCC 64411]|uniref:SET domain-containing protein n=1 Tax=Magnaporthiopsis poae (strain ATCC 64411 / 73-15) TaxID=644358 RepID=A0A0C4DW48_MAGP6|nr:hypothetical protein MAPG_04220 [Magnaporthiopsis poae ATCC 64411]
MHRRQYFTQGLGLSVLLASATHVLAMSRLTCECPAGFPGRVDSIGFTECAVPVDDVTATEDPASWAPWTHRPACLNSTILIPRGAGGERLPGIPEPAGAAPVKFCVYTHAHMGEIGLSIITTPEHAASSLHLLERPNLPHLSRASKTAATNAAPDQPSYEVVDLPGKGKGVLATRKIRRFETIMLEPAAIVAANEFARAVRRQDGYRLLHLAVDQLRDPGQVLSLARSSSFAQDDVEDLLRTNSFAGELDGEPHMGLFPRVARINHACKPKSAMNAIVANRDIEPGEEITISYTQEGLESKTRRERLEAVWGFKCTCAHCAAADATAASDERLEAARGVIISLFPEHYELLARVYNLVGRADTAAKYTAMALRVLDLYGSLEPDEQYRNLELMLRVFSTPRG